MLAGEIVLPLPILSFLKVIVSGGVRAAYSRGWFFFISFFMAAVAQQLPVFHVLTRPLCCLNCAGFFESGKLHGNVSFPTLAGHLPPAALYTGATLPNNRGCVGTLLRNTISSANCDTWLSRTGTGTDRFCCKQTTRYN